MTRPTDTQERRGVYVGPLPLLKGKEATLECYPSGQCLATFDDVETGYGHSKHSFSTINFELAEPLEPWEAQGLT
jgi:hypothetical protein